MEPGARRLRAPGKRRRKRRRRRRSRRRAGKRTSRRAGAQREEADTALPGSAAGEFSARASVVPSLSPMAPGCRASSPHTRGGTGFVRVPTWSRRPRSPPSQRPQAGDWSPGGGRDCCAPTLQGPASLFRRALGSELRACGNGGPFGTARYPHGQPETRALVPGDSGTCLTSTFSFPPCPVLPRLDRREPAVMADSLASRAALSGGPRLGGLCSGGMLLLPPGFQLCQDSYCAPGNGGATCTSYFLRPGGIGVQECWFLEPRKVVPPSRKRLQGSRTREKSATLGFRSRQCTRAVGLPPGSKGRSRAPVRSNFQGHSRGPWARGSGQGSPNCSRDLQTLASILHPQGTVARATATLGSLRLGCLGRAREGGFRGTPLGSNP